MAVAECLQLVFLLRETKRVRMDVCVGTNYIVFILNELVLDCARTDILKIKFSQATPILLLLF